MSILDTIDTFFAERKESDKWLSILTIVALIVFTASMYLLPYVEDSYQNSLDKREQLKRELVRQKAYLMTVKNRTLPAYDRDIEERKRRIDTMHKKIEHIVAILDEIPGVRFDQKSWSGFLNRVTKNAKENNVELRSIRNRQVVNRKEFGPVLDLEIRSYGKFGDVVKFVHAMEEDTLLTELRSSDFHGDSSGVTADINLSVWGISGS